MKDYERAPKGDGNATLIVLAIVVIAFCVFTALTDKPEEQAIEAIGETAYQLSR